jgi:hypothetical protein
VNSCGLYSLATMVCLLTGSRPSPTFKPLSGISHFTRERVAQSLWKVLFPARPLVPLQMLRNNLRLSQQSSPSPQVVQEQPVPEHSPSPPIVDEPPVPEHPHQKRDTFDLDRRRRRISIFKKSQASTLSTFPRTQSLGATRLPGLHVPIASCTIGYCRHGCGSAVMSTEPSSSGVRASAQMSHSIHDGYDSAC